MIKKSGYQFRRTIHATFFLLFASLLMTMASTRSYSSMMQGAGKVSIRDFSFVAITSEGMRGLPAGENRLVQKTQTPTGSVTFFVDGVARNASTPLTKSGTGTLILPNANQYGVTKVGPGKLENAAKPGPNLTKELTGTLILASTSDVVYEFRGLSAADYGRIFIGTEGNTVELKSWLGRQRPAGALNGWPPKRLLVGPAAGIAQVEQWSGKLKDSIPGSKYVCTDSHCACSGVADCLKLADSNACSSSLSCDGSANCWCRK
jgi:hypothetical protein